MADINKRDVNRSLRTTGVFSIIAVLIGYLIQSNAESKLGDIKCSYLDPISVDIAAFLAGLFLIYDGIYELRNHDSLSSKGRLLVSLRVAVGLTIITLHIMQFIHK